MLRRLLFILAIAFWIQIPVLSLRQLLWNRRPDELARLFDSNILHVAAIGGLVIIALAHICRTHARARAVAAVLAAVAFIATPYIWRVDHDAVALPLRALIASQPPATFPLLPYIGYALAGFATSAYLQRSDYVVGRTASIGILSLGIAFVLELLIGTTPPHDTFWYGSIQHSLARFGTVMIGLALALLSTRDGDSLLARVGRMSLPIYVLHLAIVYGSPVTSGLRSSFGGRFERAFDPLQVIAIVAVVALVATGCAAIWRAIATSHPRERRVVWWGCWIAFALLFATTP